MNTTNVRKRLTDKMLDSARHVIHLIKKRDGTDCVCGKCNLVPKSGDDWAPVHAAMHRLMAYQLHATNELVFGLVGTISKLLNQLSKERGTIVSISEKRMDEIVGTLVTLTAAQQVLYGHLNSMSSVGQDANADMQYDRILSFLEDEYRSILANIDKEDAADRTTTSPQMEAMFDEILKDFNPKGQAN